MRTDTVGLYIHIPFCVRKCHYCDFCSFPHPDADFRRRYLLSLLDEIEEYRQEPRLRVGTVFFGGGTPSLLSAEEFCLISEKIRSVFDIAPDAEFTMEANPKTLSRENLIAYMRGGLNRLSIGLQSTHENELRALGRIHTYEDFLSSYRLARECGVENINVDLMYGIPHQTLASFEESLEGVLLLSPEHLSVYGLIVEEGTPFYEQRDSLALPDEDEEVAMYERSCALLGGAGFRHYEISNYARPGMESRHNLTYWRDKPYIGVGLAAYSFLNGVRYGNTRIPDDYFRGVASRRINSKTLSSEEDAFEYAMLAFRLAEGLSLTDYETRFGRPFTDGREDRVARYISLGLMKRENDRLFLTERGFYVSNSILSDLL